MICWVCNEREAMLFGVTCSFCEAQAVARRYRQGYDDHRISSGALDRSAHARLDRALQQHKGA